MARCVMSLVYLSRARVTRWEGQSCREVENETTILNGASQGPVQVLEALTKDPLVAEFIVTSPRSIG
ncbi:hypothetical protein E2C01_053912 [Portunus trituberculatus]|uniref:Uncharacterized protein n=1 Tax=Portunus trituberculatus TaxID=210409 RepID=A0A5B7GQK3_PORTR|nr:hypothetical protein [Portunus trituberculatus]